MKQVILVELDSLLDTRMGTLLQLDLDYAKEQLATQAYFTRLSDEFSSPQFSQEEFKARYRWRNQETLRLSMRTPVLSRLHEMVLELEVMAINTPFVERVAIEVNCYPYKLDPAVIDAFLQSIACFVGPTAELSMVSYKPEDLTPQAIKAQGWSGLIFYEFDHWFTLHAEKLSQCDIHDVVFIVPALYVKVPPADQLTVDGKPGPSMFAVGEASLSEFLTLVYRDPRDFCVDLEPAA